MTADSKATHEVREICRLLNTTHQRMDDDHAGMFTR
jgi:hypothetical protein